MHVVSDMMQVNAVGSMCGGVDQLARNSHVAYPNLRPHPVTTNMFPTRTQAQVGADIERIN